MPGDMVIVNEKAVDDYRKSHALGKVELYEALGIHFTTGSKVFKGEAIHLSTAKRIASVLGIDVTKLIESWE